MPNSISTNLRKNISIAVKNAAYPDEYRIIREIEEHIIEVQLSNAKTSKLLNKLAHNHPWEYLRGWAEFNDNRFVVSKDTLIPRLETEVLVDLALEEIKSNDRPLQIIDVGTGSGAIIISIYKSLVKTKAHKEASYFATDTSKKTLKIAKQNKRNIIPKADIKFINANLLETNRFDFTSPTLIIANLPYIGEEEYKNLDKSVKEHEPHSALVGGNIGHELYIELLKQSGKFAIIPKQLWEASPTTIPHLIQYLDKKEIPHQVARDQFEEKRFLII